MVGSRPGPAAARTPASASSFASARGRGRAWSGDHSAGPRGMLVRLRGIAEEKPRPRGSRQPAGASCEPGAFTAPHRGQDRSSARPSCGFVRAARYDERHACYLPPADGRGPAEDRRSPRRICAPSRRRARACLPETLAGPYGPFRDGVLAGRRAPGAANTPALPVNTRSKTHTSRRCPALPTPGRTSTLRRCP